MIAPSRRWRKVYSVMHFIFSLQGYQVYIFILHYLSK
ncbi:hypothetical protein KP1_2364 [Klebsiella pneumoniae subsp. pneumoniae NTUH-K2044]|nr:hypothetical protein KP1_2364 [Klebsiella pneumoniae subsp. pneumoniae NTUH-K2044]